MRILLTNDDGIKGEGLRLLAEWSLKLGEVVIAAPKEEQSGKSMSIDIHGAYEIKKNDAFSDLGIEAYVVDSTPADCVRFAEDRLGHFDMVFSGINIGVNLGHDIAYSGTCAAAFEANCTGIPSVAFSTEPGCIATAAGKLDELWAYMTERKVFDYALMYNVNIPHDPQGVVLVSTGGPYFRDHILPVGKDLYMADYYVPYRKEEHPKIETDLDAFFNGLCSITPMTIDRTDYAALRKLQNLNVPGAGQ